MTAKYKKSITFNDGNYVIDFTVSKINNSLSTVARVSKKVTENLYSRSASDFAEQGLITEIKRYSERTLVAHKAWIEENKEDVIKRAMMHYA
ncbi:TPA: hypothetical protein ACJEU7_002375 [Acinetobacter baumannii]|uniref:hypothetical protein n=1 Tax=Acinetobacter baumannii TaxID=470 RepID=UPI0008DE2EA0|nr:hypothetical protein [Acinetobacter baumannii]KAB1665126.1 hypothetical protein F8B05_19015 [Acinetobacter baumannii]MCX3034168.1 hypothetical protein [Acinetobacter baumannii]OIH12181.1 hypothetical protein A7M79_01450 [Acinetobacter baumannii]